MFIYLRYFTSYVWASTLRTVACRRCGTEYFYAMRCHGTGNSTAMYGLGSESARHSARIEAGANLEMALQRAIEAVPCPHCGKLQPEMIRMLRWKHIKTVLILWALACGLAAALTPLEFIRDFQGALPLAINAAGVATALALPLVIAAFLRPYRVHLPPHWRVLTREQVAAQGCDALQMPYVYPDGGIHVHPSALQLPGYCSRCNALAATTRVKRLRMVSVEVPFCARCHRRILLLQWLLAIILCLGAGFSLTESIMRHNPMADITAAMLTGAAAGILAAVLCWGLLLRKIAFPIHFRRHDLKRDSAILYCRNPNFAATVLQQLRYGDASEGSWLDCLRPNARPI